MDAMKQYLFVLLACVFVVMIGYGVTLPVLPFYVERLAIEAGAGQQSIVVHVTLLTGVYPLMQLIFAPLWGRWSDRIGRRPLILIGLAGYVVAQVMFGLATSLWLLYAARTIGGILSSPSSPTRTPRRLQWPTLVTLIMFPILVTMYVRLARREEREVHSEFGEEYRRYAARTPAFLPRARRMVDKPA